MPKLKIFFIFPILFLILLFLAATVAQAALAPGNTTPKKGAGFNGGNLEQMRALGVSWAYSWYLAVKDFNDVYEHVPMVWGSGSIGDGSYSQTELTNFANIAVAHPGSYWLIWNEPDYFRQADISTTTAARIYKPLRDAIKTADSTAKFIVGGIAFMDTAWLNGFRNEYQRLYGQYPPLNGYSVHNYMGWDDYNKDEWRRRLTAIHSWMVGNGEGTKELWLTEFPCLNCYSFMNTIMTEQIPWLEAQTWLNRYAWYSTYTDSAGNAGALLTTDGGLTHLGKLYATFGNPPADTIPPAPPSGITVS